jgi:hypothetical protein
VRVSARARSVAIATRAGAGAAGLIAGVAVAGAGPGLGAVNAGRLAPKAVTASALPPPQFGRSVDIGLITGVVIVTPVGGPAFTLDPQDRSIPVGSEIDTSHGEVDLRTARGPTAGGAAARVSAARGPTTSKPLTIQFVHAGGGRFKVVQPIGLGGLTELSLVEAAGRPPACLRPTRPLAAREAVSRKVLGLLRTDAHGRFRTRGRFSATTVRGTEWDTIDRCDGTLTRVHRGVVVVHDFRLGKDVTVRAGASYLARAPGA